jgi:hypothetical protein
MTAAEMEKISSVGQTHKVRKFWQAAMVGPFRVSGM